MVPRVDCFIPRCEDTCCGPVVSSISTTTILLEDTQVTSALLSNLTTFWFWWVIYLSNIKNAYKWANMTSNMSKQQKINTLLLKRSRKKLVITYELLPIIYNFCIYGHWLNCQLINYKRNKRYCTKIPVCSYNPN